MTIMDRPSHTRCHRARATTALHVNCRTYKGQASEAVGWINAIALSLSVPLLALNAIRGALIRSLRVIVLSLGLAGAGAGLFMFTVHFTFGYCLLDETATPVCLLGCAK